jgi:hypothetical protein
MQRARQINRTAAAGEVLEMKLLHAGKVGLQRTDEPIRQDGDAFPHSLSFPHGYLAIAEVDVLHAQAETFKEA